MEIQTKTYSLGVVTTDLLELKEQRIVPRDSTATKDTVSPGSLGTLELKLGPALTLKPRDPVARSAEAGGLISQNFQKQEA